MKVFILGFISPWIIYLLITILHRALPGRLVTGYVKDAATGQLLNYRLNGRSVLLSMVLLWFVLGYLNWVDFDWLYKVRWQGLAGACVFGLVFSLWIVMRSPGSGDSFIADFYLGRLENPQFNNGKIDVKMWLYLIGAVMLELNILSFAAHHYLTFGSMSTGLLLTCSMLSFFVLDYLSFEKVHLYTYDFFAEKVGFKLGWVCLTFYPYFYSIVVWSTVDLQGKETSSWLVVLYLLLFLTGWSLARGANMQKFYFKTDPNRTFLGIRPQIISNGDHSLLVNGFWGLSRHINYLGEILMAVAIALGSGHPEVLWVWLYPLYYLALLIPRQLDDDQRCGFKYGELWREYKKRVPYRIIPFVY